MFGGSGYLLVFSNLKSEVSFGFYVGFSEFVPGAFVSRGAECAPSPLRPRLVVSRSTCPPLSHSPYANNFVIGTAVINTHTIRASPTGGWVLRERERDRERLVVGSCKREREIKCKARIQGRDKEREG